MPAVTPICFTLGLLRLSLGADQCPAGSNCNLAKMQPSKQEQLDFISQEVTELTDLMELSKQKISLLEGLRSTLNSGHNVSVPNAYLEELKTKFSRLEHHVEPEDQAPTSSYSDFLTSRTIFQPGEPLTLIQFLAIKPSSATIPSELLVAVSGSDISLFTVGGEEVMAPFNSGHASPIQYLSVADDNFIVTADSEGKIRVHKLRVQAMKMTKEDKKSRKLSAEEKISQHLGQLINVTIKFGQQMQMPSGPKITCMVTVSQGSNKFFVVGDNEGKINVFAKNGTLTGSVHATNHPDGIQGVSSQVGSSFVMYRAGTEFGFVNPGKASVVYTRCPEITKPISSAISDVSQASKALISEENGSVWVVNVKDKKACVVERSFLKGMMARPLQLVSLKGFVLMMESPGGNSTSFMALNLSTQPSYAQATMGSHVAWRKALGPIKAWSRVAKAPGDLVALLSADGTTIEVIQIIMAATSARGGGGGLGGDDDDDLFGGMKHWLILAAIVLTCGFQYMKMNKKGSDKGDMTDDIKKMEQLRKELKAVKSNKGKGGGGLGDLGGLGGLAGLGGLGSKGSPSSMDFDDD